MAERAFFVLIGLFVLQNYCYANFFESLKIKETAAGEKEDNKIFCDDPDCICYYIDDQCPEGYSECSESHFCNLDHNKPCCVGQKACASNPCENGGTCTDVGTDSFECTCQEGFKGTTCTDVVCVHPEIDMVYVMDGSGSVGKENFENMKDFIQELNKRFTIGTNDVRVAIQEYSSSKQYVYTVQLGEGNKNGNIDDLNGVVSNMPYLTGSTYTGEALKRARTVMFTGKNGDRTNVPDILILYTDGSASDKDLQFKEADLLKKNGVKIICAAFGEPSTVQQFLPDLQTMASPSCKGTGKLVFQAEFDKLDTIVNSIVAEACNCA